MTVENGIFISYRPEHTAYIVGRLHDRLAEHFGARQIVRDIKTVDGGDSFDQRIVEVVDSSAAVLAIISDRWLLNRNPAGKRPIGVPRDWVQLEIEVALRRPGVIVIPVLVEGAKMPGEQELPYSIKALAMCNPMRLSDLTWDDEVDKLIAALEEVLRPRGAASTTAALPAGAQAGPAGGVSASSSSPPPKRERQLGSRWMSLRRRRS